MKKTLLKIVFNSYILSKLYSKRKNKVSLGRHSKIKLNIYGKNNIVKISPNSTIIKGVITIFGDNSLIQIGDNCLLTDIYLWLEDNNSKIIIGNNCRFYGCSDISCIEGHQIKIDDGLLASRNVSIVNGDSHSVVDSNGNRLNWSKDISIGKHVWIGKNVNILKNGSIGSNVVIGANSLVTNDFSKINNCLIAGSPAKVIKDNVNWDETRILKNS